MNMRLYGCILTRKRSLCLQYLYLLSISIYPKAGICKRTLCKYWQGIIKRIQVLRRLYRLKSLKLYLETGFCDLLQLLFVLTDSNMICAESMIQKSYNPKTCIEFWERLHGDTRIPSTLRMSSFVQQAMF